MAQKRMFSLQVVDTDRFVEMPASAQALYFHLGMHGDDDGFVSSPRMIMRAIGCEDGDLQTLISNDFVIRFDSGVLVITDWNINNTIQKDRYHETLHRDEKSILIIDDTKRYIVGSNMETGCPQTDSSPETENSIDKIRLDKSSKEKGRKGVWGKTTPKTVAEQQMEEVARRQNFKDQLLGYGGEQ